MTDHPFLTTRPIPPGEDLFVPSPGNAWTSDGPGLTVDDLRAAVLRAQNAVYERPSLVVSPQLVESASGWLGRPARTEEDLWEAASIEWEHARAAQIAWARSWRGRVTRAWRWTTRPFRVSTWRRPKQRDWWDD